MSDLLNRNLMDAEYETIPDMRTVRVFIRNSHNQILLLKRSPNSKHFPNKLTLPGGKVDNKLTKEDKPFERLEVLRNNLAREISEEIGVTIKPEYLSFQIAKSNSINEDPEDKSSWRTYYFNMDFALPDSIILTGESQENPDSEDYSIPDWYDINNLPDDSEFAFGQRNEILELLQG